MARSVKTLLSGRYQLTGELARASSVRGWDRWLNRGVFIKIFANVKIDGCVAKRHFIDSAQALIRIEHPNVEALLDFGATDEGAPYHVMRETGVDLATLMAHEGSIAWARVRSIMLDVIAGVAALHRQRIVHGDVSPQAVALIGETARLVEFADAELCEHELTAEQRGLDVRGVAALAFTLVTGLDPIGRAPATLEAALVCAKIPTVVRAVLLRALTEPEAVELVTLRRRLAGESPRGRVRARLLDVGAAVAAVTMLSIGLWSSVASSELPIEEHALADRSTLAELVCEASSPVSEAPARSLAREPEPEPFMVEASSVEVELGQGSLVNDPIVEARQPFGSARARVVVGSEARREPVTIQSHRFDLHGELSPASLVERGIDLTHGRPTPEHDPRVPNLDGPARARELFEAACAHNYGKGCHMLGVQIAEGLMPDDGAGPAVHYRRGCELDYPRSCAALADLARAGEIDADADSLDAKACRLAGAGSSYCRPHTRVGVPSRR